MKLNKINFILASFFACWLIFAVSYSAEAATYNWYFSYSTGNDSLPGNGSIEHPWKTLEKVQLQEDTLTASDTATFYFKRGDTWTFRNDGIPQSTVLFNNCVCHIDEYGEGDARPIFDGEVTFATNPLTDVTSRNKYDMFFRIDYPGSSIKNIEVKNHHGNALYIGSGADNNTIQNCLLHNLGQAGIHTDGTQSTSGNLVEYCTVYSGMRNMEWDKTDSYGGGINMAGVGSPVGTSDGPYDNTIRYCNVYNNYGEGIWNPNGITEYNVIGDTWGAGIHVPPQKWDARTSIVRYNIIYGIAGTIYYGNANNGIKILDEGLGGDNSDGEFWIYGNIIINRRNGIWIFDSLGYSAATPYKKVRVFNNTFIDCYLNNININHPDSFADVKIYNNSSIFYSATDGAHVTDNGTLPDAQWTISNNHFYDTAGRTVDTDWDTDYQTGDPKLPKTSDWRSMSTDKDTIDFLTTLYPEVGSALINNGMTLDAEFDGMTNLFTQGTDFAGELTLSSFVMQNQTSPFSLGAVLRLDDDTTPPSAPQGLSVE